MDGLLNRNTRHRPGCWFPRWSPCVVFSELDFWDHCLTEPQRGADVSEDRACQRLVKMFESCLSRAKKTTLHCSSELDKGCKRLERIMYDATVVPTFELTLVFKQDSSAWPSLRDFLFLATCFAPNFRHVLKLSPGFRLVKKKLYSSAAGTVVEEC
uniref:DNA damage-inducible transcript 4-like protein n=1 Tax=Monopterus albus TaxID=43700 RepID=A0A3Q3R419_MONAL